jgi:hypothetical protein
VCNMVGEKNIRNYIKYFLQLVLFSLCAFLRTVFVLRVLSSYVYLLYLMCICCIVCVFVVYCVFVAPYVYLLYLMCICCIMCLLLLLL